MCVTGPQTQAGVAERFGVDLAGAVAYAKAPDQPIPRSGALYGGQGTRTTAKDVDMDRLREGLLRYIDSTLEQPRES